MTVVDLVEFNARIAVLAATAGTPVMLPAEVIERLR